MPRAMSMPIGANRAMTSDPASLRKRSVRIAGHPTSVSLEQEYWEAIGEIARRRGRSVNSLIAEIDAGRRGGGLSSAIRLYALAYFRRQAEADGSGGQA